MSTPPRVTCRAKCARWLYTSLVCSLILQFLLPPQVSLAAPIAAKAAPMVAQTDPAPNLAPFAPSTNSAAVPPSPGDNVLQTITPTLPVYLNITLDRAVMTVDETAVVTVSLYSTAALTKKQLKLVLDVPNALITTTGGKGKLRWDVPDLSAGQIFQQQITVRVDKAKKALKQGVVRFTATSNAVGHKALMTENSWGLSRPPA